MAQSVLIIGGGYLGQKLASRFCSQSEKVTVITRSQNNHPHLEAIGCKCFTRDITHPHFSLPERQYHRVYLCAAPTIDRRKVNYGESLYVKGTFSVLRLLDKWGFNGKLYAIGSTSMLKCLENYPLFGKKLVPFTEKNLEAKPTGRENPSYGQFKLLREWSSKARFKIYHIISAGQYGPDRHPGEKVMKGLREKLDNPNRWLNLVHINDLENALYFIEENNAEPGSYLVADENPITVKNLYDLYAQKLEREPVEFLPIEDEETIPDNCCKLVSEKLKSLGFKFKHMGISHHIRETSQFI